MFGCADGWAYCLRADDGQLVWRFRAAPQEQRIGAFGQLESPWPVHGSVLVRDGTVVLAAGRSSYLDGGIYLHGVGAATGKLLRTKRLDTSGFAMGRLHPERLRQVPGHLNDVLLGEGDSLYLGASRFNPQLEAQPKRRPALHARAGLLDGTYFRRLPWVFEGAWSQLISYDGRAAYHLRMFPSLRGLRSNTFFTPGREGYLLFARERGPKAKERWSVRLPVRGQAMVATKEILFVAGPPDVVDPEDPLGAFEGRKGGILRAVATADGKTLAELELASPPVFNGMAAARGRLYLSLQDGRLVCMAPPR